MRRGVAGRRSPPAARLSCGGTYDGPNTTLSFIANEQTTGVEQPAGAWPALLLGGSFPNPFGSETTIWYSLPTVMNVVFQIYDSSGRIRESRASEQPAGFHDFTWDASAYPPGVYFIRPEQGSLKPLRIVKLR